MKHFKKHADLGTIKRSRQGRCHAQSQITSKLSWTFLQERRGTEQLTESPRGSNRTCHGSGRKWSQFHQTLNFAACVSKCLNVRSQRQRRLNMTQRVPSIGGRAFFKERMIWTRYKTVRRSQVSRVTAVHACRLLAKTCVMCKLRAQRLMFAGCSRKVAKVEGCGKGLFRRQRTWDWVKCSLQHALPIFWKGECCSAHECHPGHSGFWNLTEVQVEIALRARVGPTWGSLPLKFT